MELGDIYDLEMDARRLAHHVSGFYAANGLLIHRSLLQSLVQNGMAGACLAIGDRPSVRRECLLALAAACLAKLRPYYRFRLQPLVGGAFGRIGALAPKAAAAASIEAYLKAADAALGTPHEGIALRLGRGVAGGRNAADRPLEIVQMRPIADLLAAAADGWARLLVRRTRLRADEWPVSAVRADGSFARPSVSLVRPDPRMPDNPH